MLFLAKPIITPSESMARCIDTSLSSPVRPLSGRAGLMCITRSQVSKPASLHGLRTGDSQSAVRVPGTAKPLPRFSCTWYNACMGKMFSKHEILHMHSSRERGSSVPVTARFVLCAHNLVRALPLNPDRVLCPLVTLTAGLCPFGFPAMMISTSLSIDQRIINPLDTRPKAAAFGCCRA